MSNLELLHTFICCQNFENTTGDASAKSENNITPSDDV